MMVDRGVLRRRLDGMLRYLDRLRPFRAVDRARFIAEAAQHDLAERYLHLAAEAAIDLANHIIADSGYEAPETYRSSFAVLGRHGVIDGDLSLKLQRWAGFRNVLVHDYLDVDHGLAHEAILKDLVDLEQFARVVAGILAAQEDED